MGAVSTPALAAAVARAGGLGMLGAAGLQASQLASQVEAATRLAGDGTRIGVNFLVPFLDLEALDVAATNCCVVECFYGDPDSHVVQRIHSGGALAAWQVGSEAEAAVAEASGCDIVVIQGVEAGGHVRGVTPLTSLLSSVRLKTSLPLVAAGGIGSGRRAAEVFAAGADAIRLGTRLLATPEADVHPEYVRALVDAGSEDTVVTEAFSLGWPSAPHRVLRACVEATDASPASRSPLPPTRAFTGDVVAAALYAGVSVVEVRNVQPAERVVRELIAHAAAVLSEGNKD